MSTNIRRSSRRAAVKGTTNANLEESMTISHLEVSPTHYLLDVDSQCIQRIIPIWIRIVPTHAPPIYRYQSLVGNFIKNQHMCTVTRISIEIVNTCARYLFSAVPSFSQRWCAFIPFVFHLYFYFTENRHDGIEKRWSTANGTE